MFEMDPKGRQAGCRKCGRLFGSDAYFDKHLVWKYDKDNNMQYLRCKVDFELLGMNLRLVDGVWKGPPLNKKRFLRDTTTDLENQGD